MDSKTSRGRRIKHGGAAPLGRGSVGSQPVAPGLLARELAVAVIAAVLFQHRAFDEAWAEAEHGSAAAGPLQQRDRAFARLIVATVLRRLGSLECVLATFLAKPLPNAERRLAAILLSGLAQLLLIETPPHAAISLSVEQCRLDRRTARFDKLVNALLRRATREGAERLAALTDPAIDIPAWLMQRWQAAYGTETAARIAVASLSVAPLDLTVRSDAGSWANQLGGIVLPTGSVRLAHRGRVEELPGYDAGAWWVQDAAAALPARLLGTDTLAGQRIADLCAAPGGKTATLAASGALVTALDRSPQRLDRLAANLQRLALSATVVAADAATWQPAELFDAVLLDAPCTATGTIRRHPDILRLRRESDIDSLAETQRLMLAGAARIVKPGGLLVYCTCSLQPEEGEHQVAAFLASHPAFLRLPIQAGEHGIDAAWLTSEGDLRTLPFHMPSTDPALAGLDGFFAARLRRGA